ncbi:MAG: carbon-nitrogen hydrolase family protein [Melioribacteraceae bacterium]|nr:carbon-nitrogen hydrolase family protein [Melioribacteraceae bacterium]
MKNKSSISRRNFISKTALGVGALGVGGLTTTIAGAENDKSGLIDCNKSPREVVVLSAMVGKNNATEKDLEYMISWLGNALEYKPDIICFPENFENDSDSAEEITGPIMNKYSAYAKENNSYVICTLIRKNGDKKSNSAVLIDRQGKVAGIYDKIHPAIGECDSGSVPAPLGAPVFETDFGKIGIQICFDINWLDEWRILKEKGAEIVFWPSIYAGGKMLSAYASIFNYNVVGCSKIGPSIIYDTAGDVITESGRFEKWAMAKLNLEKIHCEIDNHVQKVRKIQRKYGRKVAIKYYHNEDWVTIESRSPDLPIKQLIDEYELLNRWDYIKQSEEYQKKFRG